MLTNANCRLLYPFENQANDYSGHARHGTVHGSGVYATKPNGGRCLYFDGVGDYVATPTFVLSGTVVVFAAGVRCKRLPLYQSIISDSQAGVSGAIMCYRNFNNDILDWRYWNGTNVVDIDCFDFFKSPYDDVWLHLCIACDYTGKKTYFYRNGSLFYTASMSGTPVMPSADAVKYIGSYNGSLYNLSSGYLQNVQLSTLAIMPPLASVTANAQRMLLGLHPIWSV